MIKLKMSPETMHICIRKKKLGKNPELVSSINMES